MGAWPLTRSIEGFRGRGSEELTPSDPAEGSCVVAARLGLLADPARAAMMLAVRASGSLTASQLAEASGVSRTATAHHARRLVQHGWLRVQRRGRLVVYSQVASRRHVVDALAVVAGVTLAAAPEAPASDVGWPCSLHVAGPLGAAIRAALLRERIASPDGMTYRLTISGATRLRDLGVYLPRHAGDVQPSFVDCV